MENLGLVTYCGLYCGLCSQRNRIPERARSLRASMQKERWDMWGQDAPQFNEFWAFLTRLSESESRCSCRKGACGPSFCGIRKCAQDKGVDVCPFSGEYPCRRIKGIAKGYPTMLADAERMKAKGMIAWIDEQEKRREAGFAYVDIRYYPYEVTDS